MVPSSNLAVGKGRGAGTTFKAPSRRADTTRREGPVKLLGRRGHAGPSYSKFAMLVGPAGVLTIVVSQAFVLSQAFANGEVVIPFGSLRNHQILTVSGSGFPPRIEDPTGLQILECSDPGGTPGNLPRDASRCDGATISQQQINTDAKGRFAARYALTELKSGDRSPIDCDVRHLCVLWVGIDYNNSFLRHYAFSRPFKIGGPSYPTLTNHALAIPLSVVGAVIFLLLIALHRRRAPTMRH